MPSTPNKSENTPKKNDKNTVIEDHPALRHQSSVKPSSYPDTAEKSLVTPKRKKD